MRAAEAPLPISPPSLTPDVDYTPPPDGPVICLHEDDAVLVVLKPAGLLSVPGRGEGRQDCLIARLQRTHPDALIVHRLDMATSGLLVMALGEASHRQLSRMFHDRLVDKRYVALVHGLMPDDTGTIDLPLVTDWPRRPRQMVCHERGKPSLTHYQVLERDVRRRVTRVALTPVTGRSHQLRVHMLALGHPIVGDPLYGPGEADPMGRQAGRLCLHAESVVLPHPFAEGHISCQSPADF